MGIKKGRQMGTTLKEIRDDHIERYRVAAQVATLQGADTVADIGCGFGYGSYILAEHAPYVDTVFSYDVDEEVFKFAEKHWAHDKIIRVPLDLREELPGPADVFVAFEVIEHFHGAPEFLRRSLDLARIFVGSVPNQDIVPFLGPKVHPQHVRHYTPSELRQELEGAGWTVKRMGAQIGKHKAAGRVDWNTTTGRTLVFVAHR